MGYVLNQVNVMCHLWQEILQCLKHMFIDRLFSTKYSKTFNLFVINIFRYDIWYVAVDEQDRTVIFCCQDGPCQWISIFLPFRYIHIITVSLKVIIDGNIRFIAIITGKPGCIWQLTEQIIADYL